MQDVHLSHQLEEELVTGDTYELSFIDNTDDFTYLSFVYFNTSGNGFVETFPYGALGSSGFNSRTVEIGYEYGLSSAAYFGFVPNTLYIVPWGAPANGNVASGSIDNIALRRVIDFTSQTISFSEDVTGWVSFKSFIPESGVTLSNQYYTAFRGSLYQHNTNPLRNSFYGTQFPTQITAVLNAEPSSIKSFNTISYEGSQAQVLNPAWQGSLTTLADYNAGLDSDIVGWSVASIMTNEDTGLVYEFLEKEGKWFNYIKGSNMSFDASNFNVQGIGVISAVNLT